MTSPHAPELVAVCKRALFGGYSVVEAARLIPPLAYDLDSDGGDSDLNLFRAIDSEAEYVPVFSVRDRREEEASAAKDEELAQVESFYGDADADFYRA